MHASQRDGQFSKGFASGCMTCTAGVVTLQMAAEARSPLRQMRLLGLWQWSAHAFVELMPHMTLLKTCDRFIPLADVLKNSAKYWLPGT